MLHKETVSPALFQTLEKLMTIDSLNAFRLGGGTALALQMGHRKSVDIDLFTKSYPLDKTVFEELNVLFSHAEIRFSEFHITMYLADNKGGELKVDFMSTDDFIRPEVVHKNIRLAHPEEIAAMKLEAITSRKEKKDYWDIFILLNEYSFSQLMDFYKERYPWNDIREVIESTGTSDKCDNQPDPLTFGSKEWAEVKLKIHSELQKFLNKELK